MKNYNRGQIREKDVKGNEKELHENFSALRSSSTGSVDPGKRGELNKTYIYSIGKRCAGCFLESLGKRL